MKQGYPDLSFCGCLYIGGPPEMAEQPADERWLERETRAHLSKTSKKKKEKKIEKTLKSGLLYPPKTQSFWALKRVRVRVFSFGFSDPIALRPD